MDIGTGVAIGFAVIAVASMVTDTFSLRQTTAAGTITALKAEVDVLENKVEAQSRSLDECRTECRRLRDENFDLMRRLSNLENKDR